MAAYGPNGGLVPFTGFSPTLGVNAVSPTTAGNVQFSGMSQIDSKLSRMLSYRGNRVLRELLLTITGTAFGDVASETYSRVTAQPATFSPTDYGGLVPIEVVQQLNRVTTAGDVTNVVAAFSRFPKPTTYVADVSGNSGGGKGGY